MHFMPLPGVFSRIDHWLSFQCSIKWPMFSILIFLNNSKGLWCCPICRFRGGPQSPDQEHENYVYRYDLRKDELHLCGK